MAVSAPATNISNDIEPYRLHVSQRWLDLTKKKLELARLPREPPVTKESGPSSSGAFKAGIESLLDYWLESYDHRAQEENYNDRLPQYRTNLDLTTTIAGATGTKIPNIHFVHRRSSSKDAIPLLFCHDWGSSFIEVTRMMEGLCEPITTPTPHRPSGSEPAFHVVCPSIPGFGFSDASPDPAFGLEGTADVLHALMLKLGYRRYMLHGSKWGFLVCRTIVLRHPDSCVALHTADMEVPPPTLTHAPFAWASYHIAWLTHARYAFLSFGYVPSDFDTNASPGNGSPDKPPSVETLASRTRTLSCAFADSPTGLLALTLDNIRPESHWSTASAHSFSEPSFQDPWSPSEIIFWTMMYWLPGPEAPLRWLRNAARDTSHTSLLWRTYSPVPLGISQFRIASSGGMGRTPPAWAAAHHDLRWVRRHTKDVCRPAWEAPQDLIIDLRAFAEEVIGNLV